MRVVGRATYCWAGGGEVQEELDSQSIVMVSEMEVTVSIAITSVIGKSEIFDY